MIRFFIRVIRLPADMVWLTCDLWIWFWWLVTSGMKRIAAIGEPTLGPYECGLVRSQSMAIICKPVQKYGSPAVFKTICPGQFSDKTLDANLLCGMMPEGFPSLWDRFFWVALLAMALWLPLAYLGWSALPLEFQRWSLTVIGIERTAPPVLRPAGRTVGAGTQADRGKAQELARRYLTQARAFYGQRKYSEAIVEFRNAIKNDPGDPRAHLGLGNSYLRLGNAGIAEVAFQEAVRLDPGLVEGWIRLGQVALLRRNDEVICRMAEKAQSLEANNPEARVLMAKCLQGRNDLPAAGREIEAALAADPENGDVLMAAGAYFVQTADWDRAETAYLDVITSTPDHPEARARLAFVYRLQGKFSRAGTQVETLLQRHPNHLRGRIEAAELDIAQGRVLAGIDRYRQIVKNVSRALVARARLADLLMAVGQESEGLDVAEGIIRDNPGDVESRIILARLYHRKRLYGKAAEYAQAALQRSPENDRARRLLALSQLSLGSYGACIATVRKGLEKAPDDLNLLMILARAQFADGQRADALDVLENTARAHPASPRAPMLTAQILLAGGDKKGAVASYAEALRRAPENPVAANNLAALILETGGDAKRALRLSERAYARYSGEPLIADTYGWANYHTGRIREALAPLSMAVQMLPDSGMIHYHYGAALLKAGEKEKARRHLQTAVDSGQAFQGMAEARRLLETL